MLRVYNLKVRNEWNDKSFTVLLKLLKDMLSEDNKLPDHTYDAKKIIFSIGMNYERIHTCPNDCILHRKDYEDLESCPHCLFEKNKKKYIYGDSSQ